jgi:CDP-diacylglycerol pyrophosphatase
MAGLRRRLAAPIAAFVALLAAAAVWAADLPPSCGELGADGTLSVRAAAQSRADDPDALWRIVRDQCIPNQLQRGAPGPCVIVDLHAGAAKGYAILKDLNGVAQYLLIPTAPVAGIESAALLAPDAPNYFAAAWRARGLVEAALHRASPRDGISLVVNSTLARSQAQLHIHIDCTRVEVRDALVRQRSAIGDDWAPFDEPLAGHRYSAMRILSEELDGFDPFKLLAAALRGQEKTMGEHTLAVIGANFTDSRPGFVLVADRANPAVGDRADGTEMQARTCTVWPT